MVFADDAVHSERHVTGLPRLGTRVVDGDVHRHRKRAAVDPGRHTDGPHRKENVSVPDHTANAGRLDTDTDRSTGKIVFKIT